MLKRLFYLGPIGGGYNGVDNFLVFAKIFDCKISNLRVRVVNNFAKYAKTKSAQKCFSQFIRGPGRVFRSKRGRKFRDTVLLMAEPAVWY